MERVIWMLEQHAYNDNEFEFDGNKDQHFITVNGLFTLDIDTQRSHKQRKKERERQMDAI